NRCDTSHGGIDVGGKNRSQRARGAADWGNYETTQRVGKPSRVITSGRTRADAQRKATGILQRRNDPDLAKIGPIATFGPSPPATKLRRSRHKHPRPDVHRGAVT